MNSVLYFMSGGGVAGELVRSIDWAGTPLGPALDWPQSLRTMVSLILNSQQPMSLWWGPKRVQFYNDACLQSFGDGRHSSVMARSGSDFRPSIGSVLGPEVDDIRARRKSTWNEDHLVTTFRHRRAEETYWTYSYSPIFDETGAVGGTLVLYTEITARVLAERRSKTTRLLGEKIACVTDSPSLLGSVAEALTEAPSDIPFALIYVRDHTGDLGLVESVGLLDAEARQRADARVRPLFSNFHSSSDECGGPIAIDSAGLSGGPWPESSSSVYIASFTGLAPGGARGLIVFGLSPRLSFDSPYRDYLEQLADRIRVAHGRIEASKMRAASESERNNLLSQAPVATALLDGPQHVFRLANPLYCQMVGRSDLVGKTYEEAFPELVGTALPGVLDRVYRTGEPFVTREHFVPLKKHPDGPLEDCFFNFNLEAMRDSSGAVYGMMAVAVEISDQVRARRVLEKAHAEREKLLEELEAAARAKDEFLAMLGHELRNPLSPIVTALELMKLRGEGRTTREQMVIERQVKHLVRLVDDLLDISKITRGKVELRRETVEIAEVVAKAVEMASLLFEQQMHRLTIDVPREGGLWEGDPIRLAQVVANLLTNAARYTPLGGDIELSAAKHDGEIVIRVRDNGVGISAAMLPRIFDLFVQGKQNADRAEGGLGIGLTLVKTLVALHGGSVEACSEGPGKGSEFVIRLPAAPAGAVSVKAVEAPILERSLQTKRILVVDDNGDAADLLAEALRVAGHEVEVANDPIVALAIADRFQPDVAILDIGMPVMDGYELAARLQSQPALATCRLIALTGYGQEHDRVRSQKLGFQRHLVKPIDIEKLMTAVVDSSPRI